MIRAGTVRIHRESLHLRTAREFDVIDVTADVEKAVLNAEVEEGYALVYSRHTTFAILLNERESGLLADTIRTLRHLVPECDGYLHDDFQVRTENMHPDETQNAHAHIRQILAGRNSEYVPVADGCLALGTWQRIMLVEFDRAREREVLIQVCGVPRQPARSRDAPVSTRSRPGRARAGEGLLPPPPAQPGGDGALRASRLLVEHQEVVPVADDDR